MFHRAAPSGSDSSPLLTEFRQPVSGDSNRRRSRARFALFVVTLAIVAGGVSGGIVANFTGGGTATPAAPVGATPSVQAPAPTSTPTATPTVAPTVSVPVGSVADVPSIIERLKRSVVTVKVTATVRVGPRITTQEGTGTGIVLAADGTIATNAHVVSGAQSIVVVLPDGTNVPATVVGADETADLAVISVARRDLIPVTIGTSSNLRVGDVVVALGNALALEGGPTASMGIVSALKRSITTTDSATLSHLIQTDAAINPGDSGGPLVDLQGRVVGINTAGTTSAENIGFSIAIDDAMPVLERLRVGGSGS